MQKPGWRTRFLLPGVIAIGALSACELPPGTIGGVDGTAGKQVAVDAPANRDDGAIASRDGDTIPNDGIICQGFMPVTTPLSTDWVDQQVASGQCSYDPPIVTFTHGAPSESIFYASCTEVGGTASDCAQQTGAQTCLAGRLTALCQHNSDCPQGTLCVSAAGVGDVPPTVHPQFGTCEKMCDQSGSGQCGRCDLGCDTSLHVCARGIGGPDGG